MDLKNSWLFPFIEAIHLCGMALLVGGIVLVDIRTLGLGIRDRSPRRIGKAPETLDARRSRNCFTHWPDPLLSRHGSICAQSSIPD